MTIDSKMHSSTKMLQMINFSTIHSTVSVRDNVTSLRPSNRRGQRAMGITKASTNGSAKTPTEAGRYGMDWVPLETRAIGIDEISSVTNRVELPRSGKGLYSAQQLIFF